MPVFCKKSSTAVRVLSSSKAMSFCSWVSSGSCGVTMWLKSLLSTRYFGQCRRTWVTSSAVGQWAQCPVSCLPYSFSRLLRINMFVLTLVNSTWSFLELPKTAALSETSGLCTRTNASVSVGAEFHRSCHWSVMKFWINRRRSVGCCLMEMVGSVARARFAATSAASLPLTPAWALIQVKLSVFPWLSIRLLRLHVSRLDTWRWRWNRWCWVPPCCRTRSQLEWRLSFQPISLQGWWQLVHMLLQMGCHLVCTAQLYDGLVSRRRHCCDRPLIVHRRCIFEDGHAISSALCSCRMSQTDWGWWCAGLV